MKWFIFLNVLCLTGYAQYAPLHVNVLDQKSGNTITNKEVVVTVDDTLVNRLMPDARGHIRLLVKDTGKPHHVTIEMDQYKPLVFEKLGIYGPKGKYMTAPMVAIKKEDEK